MGEVKSLTHYFLVPKREDVSFFTNGTSIGLNSYLWAPRFVLPIVGSVPLAVKRVTLMADHYIGEMFSTLC